jgi:hypothetical protein
MKTGIVLAAALLCAATLGCRTVNVCGDCKSCGAKAPDCGAPACAAVASPTGPGAVAGTGPAAASPYDPAMVAGTPGSYGYGPAGFGGRGYGGRRGWHHGGPLLDAGPYGPPTAQVAYPYYTTRGPRDFLLNNPPSIGY